MNLAAYIEKFDTLRKRLQDIPDVLDVLVEQHKDVILSLNQDQMLFGRNTDGQPFRPGYLEDPYFRDVADAQWYRARKEHLESRHRALVSNPVDFPAKDSNTPNLIVTGTFQKMMRIQTVARGFEITSGYEGTADIEAKYDGKVFGLAPLSREYFYWYYIFENLEKHIYDGMRVR